MLSGKKRVAVKRIPSHEIMYAKTGKARGKNCGKIQTITLIVSITKLVLWTNLTENTLASTLENPRSQTQGQGPNLCVVVAWIKEGLQRNPSTWW